MKLYIILEKIYKKYFFKIIVPCKKYLNFEGSKKFEVVSQFVIKFCNQYFLRFKIFRQNLTVY